MLGRSPSLCSLMILSDLQQYSHWDSTLSASLRGELKKGCWTKFKRQPCCCGMDGVVMAAALLLTYLMPTDMWIFGLRDCKTTLVHSAKNSNKNPNVKNTIYIKAKSPQIWIKLYLNVGDAVEVVCFIFLFLMILFLYVMWMILLYGWYDGIYCGSNILKINKVHRST